MTSLDSFHYQPRPLWHRDYLVDGFSSQNRLIELPQWFRGLAQRGKLEKRLKEIQTEREHAVDQLVTTTTTVVSLGAMGFLFLVSTVWLSGWRKRQQQLEQLRIQIASDLHDEVGSNLGSIQLLSQMALEDGAESPSSAEDLREINRISFETADSMRDIVWLIHSWETFNMFRLNPPHETGCRNHAGWSSALCSNSKPTERNETESRISQECLIYFQGDTS